ncbi:uncharacterized protein LOC132038471 [Lycium ferocissimum]|uniref:uncharacterized protein LOC132038471 n=1 Tax=Lycium ferocissimum TaxID=112874 RepID=UPI002815FEBA|nr:uncharacterized protein LOC132038471 [Lycium ferocissimum]
MWVHCHGQLLTSDRLLKWGISVDPICSLCQQCPKTKEHLFIECSFTSQIWARILAWIQRDSYSYTCWEQYLDWAVSCAKGKSQRAVVFKIVFAETVYAIWVERNLRVFEKRFRDGDSIAREVAYVSNVRAPVGVKQMLQSCVF